MTRMVELPRMSWIECVPNVSDGRRRAVVDACAEAIRGAGAHLLDVSLDPDHNRSVFTCAGESAALAAAVEALFARAVAAIDLRTHTGQHPRIGAVDVVPFVPLGDASMTQCVALARLVGRTVAERFEIPVFLYEAAAVLPHRRTLQEVRRGGFEGLSARMQQPGWAPDYGPNRPHPTAGASAIGARRPLVAYNVNLHTSRLDIAKAIARRVRESSGGLPGVKAMGVTLADRGLVQVSMNLVDVETTSVARAFEAVRLEAARHGVDVLESELVGLAPAAALPPSTAALVRLKDYGAHRLLEPALAAAGFGG